MDEPRLRQGEAQPLSETLKMIQWKRDCLF